ncbi:SpoIIE family protein phosphatase [Streptomyces jeddahensis]|uniref:protein-serine/threonine phosphatase n=1 Tax=Streptomyces jeddahensis TaxID=1716141 RepID=A0A177HZB0_9ACTN|nr:SpoIIE family protein phosphatase [Streptomyces jeddahensis]OAH15498.1 phosphoserine phosphatase RsbU [Streptomyces jeddahensis]
MSESGPLGIPQAPPRAASALPEAARMRVLMRVGDEHTGVEMLRLVLHHAVADLGGLGGMVHLQRVPGESERLDLVTVSGLPREVTKAWEVIGRQDETVPARALREGALVWLPTPGAGEDLEDPDPFPGGTGIAAVPLPAPGGPFGVLSVVTTAPGPPSAVQREFLETAAGWVSERLRNPGPPAARTVTPAWSADEAAWTGPRFRQALKTAQVGTWDLDLRTGRLSWDEMTMQLFGFDPETFHGQLDTFIELLHPDDRARVQADLQDAIDKRGYSVTEYRVCRPDGTIRWVEARGQVLLGDDGEPTVMAGTLWDTTDRRIAMDSVGRALRHMSDGFLAMGDDLRIAYVNLQAERLLGPWRSLIGKLLWALPGIPVAWLEARCRQAVADRIPTGFDVRWPTDQRWYHMRLVPVPDGLTVYFTDVTEKRLAEERRTAAERTAAERTARIEQLNAALAEAVSVQDVVTAVAERVLPPFRANGLVVQLVEGDSLRVVGGVGYDRQFLLQVPDRIGLREITPNNDAILAGAPQYISSRAEMRHHYPAFAPAAFEGGKHAWAFLPLIVSGRPIGCCVISFPQPRLFGEEDRALLTALSGLVAQALERARLYDAEHVRAQELQRGLLPQELPLLPAVTVAARYLPATEGLDVGGDWYDVIPLSADRVCLVIGDVMGHGLSEAATMGRLRTAVHTLAGLELPPDEVLSHLNDVVSDLGVDFYATCLYAVYDPVARVCTFGCAGHPPPALVHPDGSVHFPALATDPPLGAATPPFETTEVPMPDGSLLVMYTDGLVESAHRDIDSGMSHLARILATAADRLPEGAERTAARPSRDARHLEQLCDTLSSALVPAQQQTSDDTALLVARTHALPAGDVASWWLPEAPIAAGQARDHVRQQLIDWRLDGLVDTTELLASELVGNVVRHARGPIQLRLLKSRSLICEVTDGSPTTPRIRRARDTDEGGRGLQLVAALSQRWGTRYFAKGKSIWTEQPLP